GPAQGLRHQGAVPGAVREGPRGDAEDAGGDARRRAGPAHERPDGAVRADRGRHADAPRQPHHDARRAVRCRAAEAEQADPALSRGRSTSPRVARPWAPGVFPMSTAEAKTRYTPEDLLRMPDGDRYELIDGQLVEINVSTWSSYIAGRIERLLGAACEPDRLG